MASVARRRPLAALSPHPIDVALGAGGRVDFDGKPGVDAELSVSRVLELGGKAARRSDVAEADVARARAAIAVAEAEVSVHALVLWSRWLGSMDRAAVLTSGAELSQSIVALLTSKAELGAATGLEVNTARLDLARSEAQLASEHAAVQALAAELRAVLGVEGVIEPPSQRPRLGVPPLATALRLATSAAPLAATALAAAESARARAQLARAGGSFDIRLGGSLGVEGEEVRAMFTLGFELPSPGQADETEAVARVEAQAAEVDAEAARRDQSVAVTRAWHRFQVLDARAAAAEGPQRVLIAESRRLVAAALDAGEGTATSVLMLAQEATKNELISVAARAQAREEALIIHTLTAMQEASE